MKSPATVNPVVFMVLDTDRYVSILPGQPVSVQHVSLESWEEIYA